MSQRQFIKLPAEVNPDSLLTVKRASQISGIPTPMLYEWRRQPWRGLRVYKLGRKVFFKADEFVRWVNANIRIA